MPHRDIPVHSVRYVSQGVEWTVYVVPHSMPKTAPLNGPTVKLLSFGIRMFAILRTGVVSPCPVTLTPSVNQAHQVKGPSWSGANRPPSVGNARK